MLTQTVEYALRAAVYLATRAPDPATTEDVALRTNVPAAYLAKILQGLSRAGLVRSQRGVGGGVSLGRSPGEMTVLEVVNAVEPIRRITTCPLGTADHIVSLCPLHSRIDAAIAAFEEAFGGVTLADMISRCEPHGPLCPPPPKVAHPGGVALRVPLAVRE